MAGDVSPKDLQTLQDGLIDGMIIPENLPGNVRDAVYQYMGGQGVDMSNPNSQITQAQLAALKQQREANDGGIFDSKIFKPIEWVGSKLYQAYSAVSILSYSLTTWGILCERRHPSSGGSSSLPPWQPES